MVASTLRSAAVGGPTCSLQLKPAGFSNRAALIRLMDKTPCITRIIRNIP